MKNTLTLGHSARARVSGNGMAQRHGHGAIAWGNDIGQGKGQWHGQGPWKGHVTRALQGYWKDMGQWRGAMGMRQGHIGQDHEAIAWDKGM